MQEEITSTNKLASDLVDDTNNTNKFVTTQEKEAWNDKLDESALTDYVKNTDYATSLKGGAIKIDNGLGVGVSTYGVLVGVGKTYNQYNSAYSDLIIAKGTLENVLTEKIGNIETILETLDVGGGVE